MQLIHAIYNMKQAVFGFHKRFFLAMRKVEVGAETTIDPTFRLRSWQPGRIQIGPKCTLEANVQITVLQGGSVAFDQGVYFRPGCFIYVVRGNLTVGENTSFNIGCHIAAYERVTIGSYCMVGPNVNIVDFDHGYSRSDIPMKRQGEVTAPVTINDDVWIGGNVTIGKGVTIGQGAIIGANAVVTRDVPPYAIVAGVPARILRYRTITTNAEENNDALAI